MLNTPRSCSNRLWSTYVLTLFYRQPPYYISVLPAGEVAATPIMLLPDQDVAGKLVSSGKAKVTAE